MKARERAERINRLIEENQRLRKEKRELLRKLKLSEAFWNGGIIPEPATKSLYKEPYHKLKAKKVRRRG